MNAIRLLLVSTIALAAACAGSEAPAPAAREPLKTGGVKPAPPGKPSAPVQVSFAQEGTPQVGVALPIEVMAMPTVAVDRLVLDVGVSDGLDFVPGDWESGPLEAGFVVKRPVKVTPRGEGEFTVRVTATTWVGDQREAKVVTHTVTVGRATRASGANGKPETTPSGERVISMPASEPPRR